ncbi:hypothetical protein VTN00DRAFT_10432 [Thermoascus crustaceus]|uniref:uncharacterized protein n=1 Tax=Thermoascus crustaceus TaxID=5088 RepID=UPI0037441000
MTGHLFRLLNTTLALSEQFQSTLFASTSESDNDNTSKKDSGPLPLLSASSTALKAHVTKLSLLTINSPFTPSAVCTVLSALNDSVLPSLVTAALLITPDAYTKAFHTEILILAKNALKELYTLVQEVKSVAEKKDQTKKQGQEEEDLLPSEKNNITAATGRAWDSCDTLIELAGKGVVGFVVRRVEEWRDLVRDAIGELEEWDPDEEYEDFDDLLGESNQDTSDVAHERNKQGGFGDAGDEDDGDDAAALHAYKKSILRVLKPVAQIYPTIVTNRLKNGGLMASSSSSQIPHPSYIPKLESLMSNLQSIPDHIDEAAGALYESDIETSVQHIEKAKMCAAEAVELLARPWEVVEVDGERVDALTEDKYTAWSRTWLKVMEEVGRPIDHQLKKKETI